MMHRHTALAWALVGAFVGIPGAVTGQQLPSMDEVIDHLDEMYRSESSHAVMTMTVVRERGTRELTMESWSEGEDNALIVIRSPAREAGTATLMTEEGLWNYAPRADRLIRIPTGLLSESWMGSHFTNDDLMRETSYDEDYRTELSWAERDGQRRLLVTLTPKPDAPVVYTRILFFLTPGDWIPVREEFYDEGELIRTMTFDRVETVNGKPIPMRMTLTPIDDPDERTVVEYRELEFDVQVDDALFTRRGLRRVAG
ncbi:MAG: outer membrane lipoprotein-sorting protein [Longimicrobiales bacterium]